MSIDLTDTEASFLPNLIDSLCLRVDQMYTSRDMVIFVLMTTTTTTTTTIQPITLPLAHACGVTTEMGTYFSFLMKIAGYSLAFAKLQALYLSSMIKKAT